MTVRESRQATPCYFSPNLASAKLNHHKWLRARRTTKCTTGITASIDAGGTREKTQRLAAHESPRTTKRYDRTGDAITLDEVERIRIEGDTLFYDSSHMRQHAARAAAGGRESRRLQGRKSHG